MFLCRMDDQDRVSQASSVATISYFPVMTENDGKVQTFGKRCQAAKRDPNCPVVIRGWLNKKDSSGLKLWKRRWFVLSNYCLYYYKDSREESVLGSIPLPSYKILFCTPRECKNRKFTFKVVHQGMRSYFFSADTQEDMLGWVRALSQSAAMELDATINRRCSSYQDFTLISASTESVDFPKSPSDELSPSQKHKHVSRTLSEPSHLGGRVGRSHSEQRGRRNIHHRNRSPSNRTPSPTVSSRRAAGPNMEEDSPPDENTAMPTEISGANSLTSRGQLGSRPHTPMGRVDIRPRDDPVIVQQTLYYAPASPKPEYKSAPTTPVTERWQTKPAPIYGAVHHAASGRRPLGKSLSTGADLLPPLPPSSRAAHALHPQQHHQRSFVSACMLPAAMASNPDPRELLPIRPLESDADAVLTRLCGCDKLLQSLSGELAQLQIDKDSVQCALEVSRLQVEDWKNQGPRALEEVLTQKALLQDELVTIRARMCDVSLEMERVWSQYERMESELSVIRSHLQHICNFGMPQEQSQAQRELWMMEDILDGLRVNRDHICFLLRVQRHHTFQSLAPHPGSPGSPMERPHSSLDMDHEPPVRPPLPLELQENHQGFGWTESPYEGIYSLAADPVNRIGNSQPDLLNVKAQRDISDSQFTSKRIPPDTSNQSTKKTNLKMSEEEQIERMERNKERVTNKPPLPNQSIQSQSSQANGEPPFPLRVTRVVTAVLPSSLVARRVSVEDPPAELHTSLPEQIPPEMQKKLPEQSKKLLDKPSRQLLLEGLDPIRPSDETQQGHPVRKTSRKQPQGGSRGFKMESLLEMSKAEGIEASSTQTQDLRGLEEKVLNAEELPSAPTTHNMDPNFNLNPEQRDAKLRRVERIRERVMRSAAREKATTDDQHSTRRQEKGLLQVLPDKSKLQTKAEHKGLRSSDENSSLCEEVQFLDAKSQDNDKEHQEVNNSGNRTQRSGKKGVAKTKTERQPSPCHISSMTVYQEDGGKGFKGYNEQKNQNEFPEDDNEFDVRSSGLRAKWFLSTKQWHGFTPLQVSPLETVPSEENADSETQATSLDDTTDSNGMSSAVSESLEKMKDNLSLFYKIACDISISDSDITKSDAQISTHPEEENLLISESVLKETTSNPASSPEQVRKDSRHHLTAEQQTEKVKDRKVESSERSACIQEIPKKLEDRSIQDCELQIIEAVSAACVEHTDSEWQQSGCAETKEEHRAIKKPVDRKVDQEGCEELKKSTSLSKVINENEQEKEDKRSISLSSFVHEGGGVLRSASFGKPRVTVLRTSL
uniref:PH domain-containing protein n=1 Tax=Oryzias latipes TaxID=8090 RepID=A0A3B3HP93_ORYLA